MNTDEKTGANIFSTLLVGIFFLIGFVVGIHVVGTIMMSAIHDELSCINPLDFLKSRTALYLGISGLASGGLFMILGRRFIVKGLMHWFN